MPERTSSHRFPRLRSYTAMAASWELRRRCCSEGVDMAETWAAALWGHWQHGSLAFQHCSSCDRAQHPPGPVCSYCHATSLDFRSVSGTATLLAWSTVHRAPSAQFSPDLPYTLAIVQLREGA